MMFNVRCASLESLETDMIAKSKQNQKVDAFVSGFAAIFASRIQVLGSKAGTSIEQALLLSCRPW
jgi:hypothetical protein